MFDYSFPTDAEQIYERILAIDPKRYDQTRNHLDGYVSRLSPYFAHGFLTLPLVRDALFMSFRPLDCYRFIYELCWREFFSRYMARFGEKAVCTEQEARKSDLPCLPLLPDKIKSAKTGLKALDFAFQKLYEAGYMHNHARMWAAAYTTHYARTQWQTGARLFFFHLLDGDLASNNLSWQWVFGTFSDKVYYFNQDNINKYSPAEFRDHRNLIDKSYEDLYEDVFVQKIFVDEVGARNPFMPEPEFGEIAGDTKSEEEVLALLHQHDDVIYFHEWMLNPMLVDEFDSDGKALKLFIVDRDFWVKNPASAKRFRFMVDLAKNIPGVVVYLGDPAALLRKAILKRAETREPLRVYSQEYFSENVKNTFTSLRVTRNVNLKVKPFPWLVPHLPVVPNRFGKFFKLIERELFGQHLPLASQMWRK